MGQPIMVVDLATRFIELHGLEPQLPEARAISAGPGIVPVIYTGARPGEKLHEELAFDAEAMRPTRHPDINIWLLPAPEGRYVEHMVSKLSANRRRPDAAGLAQEIRSLVPEMALPIAA
jgi:FlaA1/EpsC-like NDP-sugar epimerase